MEKLKLRYGLIGVGPIGCTIAAHLCQGGADVIAYSIDTEATKALRAQAIRVGGMLTAEGRLRAVFTDLAAFLKERPDIILLATKSCHNATVIADLRRHGGIGDAVVISCQNGLDVEEQIAKAFGPNHSLRMVMNLGCTSTSSGEIDVKFSRPNCLSSNKDVSLSLTQAVAGDLSSQGFQVELCPNYRLDVFKKVILNSSLSPMCALTGLTMRGAIESPEVNPIISDLVNEGIRLARADGLDLPEGFHKEAMDYLRGGGDHRPSMVLDINLGRPTENEDNGGALVRLGEKRGVPMPVTKTIYNLLKDLEKRRLEKTAKER